MLTSILGCGARRQRVLATFLGITMLCAWPVSGQTIYPVEPPTTEGRSSVAVEGRPRALRAAAAEAARRKARRQVRNELRGMRPGPQQRGQRMERVRGHRQHGFQRHGPRALGALPGLRAGVPPARRQARSSSPASWRASAWGWSTTACRRSGAAGSTAGCSTRFR